MDTSTKEHGLCLFSPTHHVPKPAFIVIMRAHSSPITFPTTLYPEWLGEMSVGAFRDKRAGHMHAVVVHVFTSCVPVNVFIIYFVGFGWAGFLWVWWIGLNFSFWM